MQDLWPGSVKVPLIYESREYLIDACMRIHYSNDTMVPDVTLKLGDHMLPAQRSLLADCPDYFKTMFQVSFLAQRWMGPGMNRT